MLDCSTCWLILSDTHSLAALFTSRAASMGGFTVLFIVTPELYPTKIRSFALGLNNSMSRLGAILSPLVSVGLTKSGHLRAAEGIIAACCTIAAICICCLPKEMPGRSLEVRNCLLAPRSRFYSKGCVVPDFDVGENW
jgi:nitrate/nitrite transporter NarK